MPILRDFQMCNFGNDISTEELAHLEMVASIVYQLTKNLSMEEIENSGFKTYYVDHTLGIWPRAASGMPFSVGEFQSCVCYNSKIVSFPYSFLRNPW